MILERLQERLAYRFRDPALLQRALTHRSYGSANNERLEFLGDGLINFVVGEALFQARPKAEEGDLSRLRATLVCEPALARIAVGLELGDVLLMGPGELKSGGFRRDSILADALEALMGAVYLDGGFAEAQAVCGRLFAAPLAELPEATAAKDAKTRLQEILQGCGRPLPEYTVLTMQGPPHQQVFTTACRLKDGPQQTTAEGSTRKQAEQAAAERMLGLLSTEIQHA